jgi:hypothetical protein
LKWQLPVKDDTKIQALTVLQQVVYRIKELNRFLIASKEILVM